jgi:hypothetical protein
MSNVAVIITSERCGHCRNMRGSGRLLSQNEIKKGNKQPNIPGGYHYDSKFMKKLITANMDGSAKLRVINVNYRTFNPAEGVMDISVFTLDPDGNTVRQTMLTEKDGKTVVNVYTIGENGQVVSTQDMPNSWTDITKTYIPVNLPSYAFFFPSLVLFEGNAWTEGIRNNQPIYGYLNGFETKSESPYGAKPGPNPSVSNFDIFIQQFFNGTKELLGKPKTLETPVVKPEPVVVEPPKPKEDVPAIPTVANVRKNENEIVGIPTIATRDKFKVRLYVVEK